MAFTVVYDACILFPIALRDLFMAAAKSRPSMTYDEVLDVLSKRGLIESVRALRGPS